MVILRLSFLGTNHTFQVMSLWPTFVTNLTCT